MSESELKKIFIWKKSPQALQEELTERTDEVLPEATELGKFLNVHFAEDTVKVVAKYEIYWVFGADAIVALFRPKSFPGDNEKSLQWERLRKAVLKITLEGFSLPEPTIEDLNPELDDLETTLTENHSLKMIAALPCDGIIGSVRDGIGFNDLTPLVEGQQKIFVELNIQKIDCSSTEVRKALKNLSEENKGRLEECLTRNILNYILRKKLYGVDKQAAEKWLQELAAEEEFP